jgi:hypothetical protein
MATRAEALKRIDDEHAAWQALLAEIGKEHMEEPGPMGDWPFKDLVAHLLFWNERTVARLEAGPDATMSDPWPASMGTEDEIEDWDEVNAWVRGQYRDRSLDDVLAEKDRQYERFAAAIAAMPEDDLMTPGRWGWGDRALVDANFFGHFHEEHEADVRAWLQTR